MSSTHRARIALATLLSASAIAACSSGHPNRVVTKTVQAPAASPTSARAVTSPPVAAPPKSMKRLPGTCHDLLPTAVVDNALNTTLHGKTNFVVGTPDPTIGRVGYLNCRYGVAAATPAIEIGVSLYRTSSRAAARIAATVDDYGNHGASAKKVTLAGTAAMMLTGGRGAGYDAPTVVLSFGQRTVAVSVGRGVPTAQRAKTLTVLAALALRRTAP